MAIISLIHSHYLTMDSFFVHKQIDIFKALSLWLTQGYGLVPILDYYFPLKRRFSLLSVQTWSKVHMKVIIPGKLPLSLRSKNVLILSSYESFS